MAADDHSDDLRDHLWSAVLRHTVAALRIQPQLRKWHASDARTSTPEGEAVARWMTHPGVLAWLDRQPYRRRAECRAGLLDAAELFLADEDGRLRARWDHLRSAGIVDTLPALDRIAVRLLFAIALQQGPAGGPRVPMSRRALAEFIAALSGPRVHPRQVGRVNDRLAEAGIAEITKGSRWADGHQPRASRSTVYDLLPDACREQLRGVPSPVPPGEWARDTGPGPYPVLTKAMKEQLERIYAWLRTCERSAVSGDPVYSFADFYADPGHDKAAEEELPPAPEPAAAPPPQPGGGPQPIVRAVSRWDPGRQQFVETGFTETIWPGSPFYDLVVHMQTPEYREKMCRLEARSAAIRAWQDRKRAEAARRAEEARLDWEHAEWLAWQPPQPDWRHATGYDLPDVV